MSLGTAVALVVERIVEPVEAMHRTLTRPWFAAFGAPGRMVGLAHDTITGLVYGSIRTGAAAVAVGIDTRVAVDSPSAEVAQAFVDGLWGDELGRHGPRLATSMSVRDRQGGPIPVGPDLAAALPTATGRVVVLVHGLIETERCWHGTDGRPGLIDSLEDHPVLTPVAVRYNSGLPVASNGALLASLLEALHAHWPQPVRSIALVGHSMGGLVARSACAAADRAGHRWIEEVTDVITIGSPHRGAPLEKLVAIVARALGAAPQSRPLADFLDARSQGIKDLRFGSIGVDPGAEPGSAGPAGDVEHHFVAGVITANPVHPVGALVGDLMVRPASSTRAREVAPSSVAVVGGTHHFDLLHQPAVVDRVMGWLAPRRPPVGLHQPAADEPPSQGEKRARRVE